VTLTGNTFTGNSASGGGGGGAYYSGSSGTVTLTGNTFTGNSANSGGGAYCFSSSGTVTLTGNSFNLNAAITGGGFDVDGSTVRLLDNLFVKNSQSSSSSKGGGVWVRATALDMINNTVTANTAAGSGGGVAFQVDGVTEVLHVYNNIIWGNTAGSTGADVHLVGTGSRKEFLFNDAHDMYGVWDIAVNNLDVAPLFFDPVNGDYHLRNTSACVNAGTNGAPQLPATDLDGGARIANGTVDMGCYEFGNTIPHPADVNNDWVITDAEYTAYAAAWKNDQTWNPGPNPIPADYVTRAGYLKANGGAYHNDGSTRPTCWKPGAP
jgi:parallel beta-helix repeat protein